MLVRFRPSPPLTAADVADGLEDRLGNGAVVTARSLPDQLPEAIEWPGQRYALGVQWHPEAAELQHALTDFVNSAAHALGGQH